MTAYMIRYFNIGFFDDDLVILSNYIKSNDIRDNRGKPISLTGAMFSIIKEFIDSIKGGRNEN